jgi:tetratricopeptide (TPR) repeat protein
MTDRPKRPTNPFSDDGSLDVESWDQTFHTPAGIPSDVAAELQAEGDEAEAELAHGTGVRAENQPQKSEWKVRTGHVIARTPARRAKPPRKSVSVQDAAAAARSVADVGAHYRFESPAVEDASKDRRTLPEPTLWDAQPEFVLDDVRAAPIDGAVTASSQWRQASWLSPIAEADRSRRASVADFGEGERFGQNFQRDLKKLLELAERNEWDSVRSALSSISDLNVDGQIGARGHLQAVWGGSSQAERLLSRARVLDPGGPGPGLAVGVVCADKEVELCGRARAAILGADAEELANRVALVRADCDDASAVSPEIAQEIDRLRKPLPPPADDSPSQRAIVHWQRTGNFLSDDAAKAAASEALAVRAHIRDAHALLEELRSASSNEQGMLARQAAATFAKIRDAEADVHVAGRLATYFAGLGGQPLPGENEEDGDVFRWMRKLGGEGRMEELASFLAETARGQSDSYALAACYRAAALIADQPDSETSIAEWTGALFANQPEFCFGQGLVRVAGWSPAERKRARRETGTSIWLGIRAAELLEFSGDHEAAAAAYERACMGDELERARPSWLRAAMTAGKRDTTLTLLRGEVERAREKGSTDLLPWVLLWTRALERQGDADAAAERRQEAYALDPSHHIVLRALERNAIAEKNNKELRRVGFILLGLLPEHDLFDYRLGLAVANSASDIDAASALMYEHLRSVGPSRAACFLLDSQLGSEGTMSEGELCEHIATVFSGDAPSEGAFRLRAALGWAKSGRYERARQSFERAAQTANDAAFVFSQWRRAAAQAGEFGDVVDTAVEEAEGSASAETRRPLWHLAAVTAMDKLSDSERATALLEKLVDAEPENRDAYLRLRRLYETAERHDVLMELHRKRLSTESDEIWRVSILEDMARIQRDVDKDPKGACRTYQDVLALDPGNREVIAALAELTWQLEQWSDAAEMLVCQARYESDRPRLAEIYYRLAVIYADHLDDAQWAFGALEKMIANAPDDPRGLRKMVDLRLKDSDWDRALPSAKRLADLPGTPAEVSERQQLLARIYVEGKNDRDKAERAYLRALEADPGAEDALDNLIKLHENTEDQSAVRVHFDRVASLLRGHLLLSPHNAKTYRLLAKTLSVQARAEIAGTRAIARLAAQAAMVLGDDSMKDLATSEPPPLRLVELGVFENEQLLFPLSVAPELRSLLSRLGGRIGRILGRELSDLGVTRDEAVRDRAHPLLAMCRGVANALCVSEPEVYLSKTQTTGLLVEPTQPATLVFGKETAELPPAELRFLVGRALFAVRAALAIPIRLQEEEFAIFLRALLENFDVDGGAFAEPSDALNAEKDRQKKLVPNNLQGELRPYAVAIAGHGGAADTVWKALHVACCRAGLLVSGDVAASVAAVLRMGGYASIQDGKEDARVLDALTFGVSEEMAKLCAIIGD